MFGSFVGLEMHRMNTNSGMYVLVHRTLSEHEHIFFVHVRLLRKRASSCLFV
ncbi:hypothetical protein Hanom_Chr07g00604571 [Helianthus anomalus]